MKRILFLPAIFTMMVCVHTTSAQSGSTTAKGTFQMKADKSSVPVNTSFSVAPAGDQKIVLQLRPDQPVKMNARIINSHGVEVQAITSQEVTGRFAQSIDVSMLPKGNYFIEVFSGEKNETNYRIPFTNQ